LSTGGISNVPGDRHRSAIVCCAAAERAGYEAAAEQARTQWARLRELSPQERLADSAFRIMQVRHQPELCRLRRLLGKVGSLR